MKVTRRNILLSLILGIVIWVVVDRRRQACHHANVRTILSEGLDGRLIPHRINRLEKLESLLDRGLRSMEIDVLFHSFGTTGYFEVGHDERDARGVRLETFLERMRPFEIRKIWLDMKNVGPTNLPAVEIELQRLDSLYGIKKIAIVESYTTSPRLSSLGSRGFQTAYYLPEKAITELLDEGDASALAQRAQQIAAQVETQLVQAVSFRLTLYPFVKTYLEPLLPPAICYHAWGWIKLRSCGVIDALKSRDFYRDDRLGTIIYQLF